MPIAVLVGGNFDGTMCEMRHGLELYQTVAIPIRLRARVATAYYDRDPEYKTDWKLIPYWARKSNA